MAIYIYDYKKVSNNSLEFANEDRLVVNTFCPIPTETDYKNGFIIRHFAQKTNDKNGYIYELNESSNIALILNPFYTTTSIRWRLTGTNEEINESNYKSVKLGAQKIPLLIKYLPNYLQFRQKNNLELY